tara:strand:- start:6218 stop:7105 length:888 start_codon:yes stop_codon:yes gene_type:complete
MFHFCIAAMPIYTHEYGDTMNIKICIQMTLAEKLLDATGIEIGSGTYSTVYRVRDSGVDYAVKHQDTLESSFFYAAVREEFCGGFDHPNLIKRFSSVWSNYRWCGVYELGVPLQPSARPHRVLWDIAQGLAFLHARGIVHRDITPHNIVSVGDTYKIIDFGLARPMRLTSCCQTPGMVTWEWRPVEILRGENTDARCDVWSLGVICMSLNRQKCLFNGTKEEIFKKYEELEFDYQECVYSKMVCDLEQRFTSFALCDALGFKYDLEVSLPYIKRDHRRALLGFSVDIDKYTKNGF